MSLKYCASASGRTPRRELRAVAMATKSTVGSIETEKPSAAAIKIEKSCSSGEQETGGDDTTDSTK